MIVIGIAALSVLVLIGITIWMLQDPNLDDDAEQGWRFFVPSNHWLMSNFRFFSKWTLVWAIGVLVFLMFLFFNGPRN